MTMRKLLQTLLPLLLLAACSSQQGDDLDQFINESGKNMKGKVDPLPSVTPYVPVAFNADGTLSDPFVPRKAMSKSTSSLQPDTERPKDPGESYPLESLQFVGVLTKTKQQRVMLKTPDNTMLEAKVGDHIGQNYGLITTITDNEIQLKEIVQDETTGEWVERRTSITLQE